MSHSPILRQGTGESAQVGRKASFFIREQLGRSVRRRQVSSSSMTLQWNACLVRMSNRPDCPERHVRV